MSFKLSMAHGITTVETQVQAMVWTGYWKKKKSAQNLITAPRIFAYTAFGMGAKRADHHARTSTPLGERKCSKRS
ncbi:MAG: hypothetical protein IPF93_08945 [Saprospiraceae bacterium]|nr:hypothetical protein [Saprospiraceae bacterium]